MLCSKFSFKTFQNYPNCSRSFPNFNIGAAVQELRVLLVLLSGAVATVFACFGVCPAEACRIRMVADPELNAKGLLQVVQAGGSKDWRHIWRQHEAAWHVACV